MTQGNDKKALGRVALKRTGELAEDPAAELEALQTLSEQYGVPGIDLNQVCIRLDDLELLPREIAERRLILPVLVRDDRVFVAMTNPSDKKVVDELEFVTGKRVFPYVALQAALVRVIASAYDGKARGESFYVGPLCPIEIQRKMGALQADEADDQEPPMPPPRGGGFVSAPVAPPPLGQRPSTAPQAPSFSAQPSARNQTAMLLPTQTGRPQSSATNARPGSSPGERPGSSPGEHRSSSAMRAAPPVGRSVSPSALPPPMFPAARSPEPAVNAGDDDTAQLSYTGFGDMNPELSVVAELPTGQPGSRSTAGATGKTVLLVDDEPDIRKLLARVLSGKGLRVIEADRGLEALRLVKAHMPDLLVLDAMLPEVHGFEIARRVKGSAKYSHIPIVMISAVYKGWRFAEDARTSYGVEAYIEKPFRINDVVSAVEKALAGARGPGTVAPTAIPQMSLPSAASAAPPAPPAPEAGRAPSTAPAGPLAASRAPRDPNALSREAEHYLNAGVAAYQAGNIDEAIEQLQRGLAIDGLAFRLHFHLGLLYGKKGMVYEAIQELESAVEQNPRHFSAIKNLAVLYQKSGFRNKAVEAWERALRVAPDEPTRASIKQHLLTLL
jgi:CheY-like chemotaxis protein